MPRFCGIGEDYTTLLNKSVLSYDITVTIHLGVSVVVEKGSDDFSSNLVFIFTKYC